MKPFIVAEIGGNHLGSLKRALDLVEVAAEVGANAVKFQTFTPEQMVAPNVMIREGPWAGLYALELYQRTHTPRAWHKELFAHAAFYGIEAFSSVFHPDDVDFLETLNCPRYKIASFEITDLNLINHAGRKGKPLILSTGMAGSMEIGDALLAAGQAHTTLLKCTSAYPAELVDANLLTMADMAKRFHRPVGLSDHTLGSTAAVAATALCASVIEKHFTLSRKDGGADAAFSAEPHELAELVASCREVASSLGVVRYGATDAERVHLPLRRPPGGMRGS